MEVINGLYKPTNDYFFKRIFGQKKNSDLLKDLLEAILTEIKIDKLEVNQEVSLERQIMTDKLGVLDIVATLNTGIKVNIEMQIVDNHNTIERSVFYETGLFHENLQKKEDYIQIPKSIGIWILNYDIFNDGPFHEIARLKREYQNTLLTDKLEIHYIQLPKFQKNCKKISNKLDEWLTFISNENLEEMSMIKNKYVKKAEEELEYLNGDAAERRLAELREKAIRDEAAAMAGARRRGIEEGSKQIAKKMLEKGTDINFISEVTGLTKEEIENL
jgi:predicted transposase/invertase (TIGR01784 family)